MNKKVEKRYAMRQNGSRVQLRSLSRVDILYQTLTVKASWRASGYRYRSLVQCAL